MINGKTSIKKNKPLAFVLEPDELGHPRFEISLQMGTGPSAKTKVHKFSDIKIFKQALKALSIHYTEIIDKRKKKMESPQKKEIHHDPTMVHTYRKINPISAMQFLSGVNNIDLESFATASKGKLVNMGKYYRVFSIAKNSKNATVNRDKPYDNLRNGDYIICQSEGDVYACTQDVFEEIYDFAFAVDPKLFKARMIAKEKEEEQKEEKAKAEALKVLELKERLKRRGGRFAEDKQTQQDDSENEASKPQKKDKGINQHGRITTPFPDLESVYNKKASVKAIQFKKSVRNHQDIEDFITNNGTSFGKFPDKYRVYSVGGGFEYLEDGDYVVHRKDNDVYACPRVVFEKSYDVVAPSNNDSEDPSDDELFNL